MTMEQVSGMAWLTGFPEHDPGALFGPCDPGAGLHALIGLFVALERRRRTGEGRLVECPMVANALNVAGEQVIEFSAHGVRLDRMGNRGLAAAPQNSYACADWDDDLGQHRWVSLAVATDEQWAALRAALGDPAWAADPALATMAGRMARHDDLDAELAAWCAARPAAEVVDTLWPAGVPVAVCVHPCDQLEFPQLSPATSSSTSSTPCTATRCTSASRSACPASPAPCTAARPRCSASTTPRSSATSSASPPPSSTPSPPPASSAPSWRTDRF